MAGLLQYGASRFVTAARRGQDDLIFTLDDDDDSEANHLITAK
jgi:hypothetical protein